VWYRTPGPGEIETTRFHSIHLYRYTKLYHVVLALAWGSNCVVRTVPIRVYVRHEGRQEQLRFCSNFLELSASARSFPETRDRICKKEMRKWWWIWEELLPYNFWVYKPFKKDGPNSLNSAIKNLYCAFTARHKSLALCTIMRSCQPSLFKLIHEKGNWRY